MGKTSAAVKNKYAAKAYDRLQIIVKKAKNPNSKPPPKVRGQP